MLRSSAQGVDPPVRRVLDVAGKMLRSSAQGVDPPVCRTPGCYCYICKRQLCGFPQCAASWMTYARDSFADSPSGAFCPLEGGAQTHWHQSYSSSLWHCLGHSQASLQCHFSRCKVVLCLEDDVLYQVHRVDQGLCSVFIKGVVPPWGDLCVLWHPSEDVDLAHRKVLCHFQANE